MIRPPGFAGAAFGTSATGDLRKDAAERIRAASELGIPSEWAYLNQVHGATVLEATHPGLLGDGDAIVVYNPGIPVMVATADCVPVILEAKGAACVVHAGWRGASAGVLQAAIDTMAEAGQHPVRAAIGPAIGPCCYEVGEEVTAEFPGFVTQTTWGTTSVDIRAFLASQLEDLEEVWQSEECTYTSLRMSSWRRDSTKQRQVTVAWLPDS
jgi:polyphenol oxidase